MECRTAQQLLEAYLDNELERADARLLEAHVDGCADCRDSLRRLDELRRALREPGLRYAAPEALRARIAAAVPAALPARRRGTAGLRYAAAVLLAFGAGASSVYLWTSQQSTQERLSRDLFAGHWRALAAASPVDVVSSDRHTVKPWFAGKLAQAPLVLDFAEQGFALLGGRLDYLGSERVPVLVYRHGQHVIDVFVLPSAAPLPATTQAQGYSLGTVRLGDQRAAVVSDMDAREAAQFEALLANAR
jgi:anti-sigma factor RsiW